MRKTRKQRYINKLTHANFMPISIGCVNFEHDGNLAFLIRACACFGVQDIHVIGSVPHRSKLNPISGSTYDFVNIIQHKNPLVFLQHMREREIKIVSAEIADKCYSLHNYRFDFSSQICIFTGHETTGVPTDIMRNSDIVKIDMPGIGFCLNTSQAANIMLYEASRQFNQLDSFSTCSLAS